MKRLKCHFVSRNHFETDFAELDLLSVRSRAEKGFQGEKIVSMDKLLPNWTFCRLTV
jgi:hypothetical protein